ncbi:high mobility group box domain-containing protein [Mycotypha africana]|uniref:high mobility group box domain-containing protein n=1 Tax=Mycotypha africana TaxID=64632 RepID=UPI002301E659|nr:high mobility group box domain-containing protein [Mycotypha africana]KAI8966997.1 high mobility group box domain-containing protein [Mycotypha africana]
MYKNTDFNPQTYSERNDHSYLFQPTKFSSSLDNSDLTKSRVKVSSNLHASTSVFSDHQVAEPLCLPPIIEDLAPSRSSVLSTTILCEHKGYGPLNSKIDDVPQTAIFIVDNMTQSSATLLSMSPVPTSKVLVNSKAERQQVEQPKHIVSPEAIREALKEEKEEALGQSETRPFSQYPSFHTLKQRRYSYETKTTYSSNTILPHVDGLVTEKADTAMSQVAHHNMESSVKQIFQKEPDVMSLTQTNAHAISISTSEHNLDHPPTAHSNPGERLKRPPNAYLLFNRDMRKKLLNSSPKMSVAEISKEIGETWKALLSEERQLYVNEASMLKQALREKYPNLAYNRRSKAELAEAKRLTKYGRKKKNHSCCLQKHLLTVNNATIDTDKQTAYQGAVAPASANIHCLTKCAECINSSASKRIKKMTNHQKDPRGRKKKKTKHPLAPKHPMSAYLFYLASVYTEVSLKFPGSTVGPISKSISQTWHAMSPEERSPWKQKADLDKARYAREMQEYMAQTNSHNSDF